MDTKGSVKTVAYIQISAYNKYHISLLTSWLLPVSVIELLTAILQTFEIQDHLKHIYYM